MHHNVATNNIFSQFLTQCSAVNWQHEKKSTIWLLWLLTKYSLFASSKKTTSKTSIPAIFSRQSMTDIKFATSKHPRINIKRCSVCPPWEQMTNNNHLLTLVNSTVDQFLAQRVPAVVQDLIQMGSILDLLLICELLKSHKLGNPLCVKLLLEYQIARYSWTPQQISGSLSTVSRSSRMVCCRPSSVWIQHRWLRARTCPLNTNAFIYWLHHEKSSEEALVSEVT